MSAIVERFLCCDLMVSDYCEGNYGVDNRDLTIKQHRKNALNNGWHYLKGRDICSECWKIDRRNKWIK